MEKAVKGRVVVAFAAVLLSSISASATSITSYTGGLVAATFVPGQSITTGSGGPWNDLSFNFFSDVPALTPTAAGSLFLLSQEYLGTPAALSSATAGFIAESQSISGGIYFFDPTVTILANTQYFFYTTVPIFNSGGGGGTGYAGGENYQATSIGTPFINPHRPDANFQLTGDVVPVPEPGSLLLLGAGVFGLAEARRRFSNKRE